MLAAGRLDRRITLQRATATQDGVSGEQVLTWADDMTLWASVEPLAGSELFRAQQLEAKADTRFRIRYRTGVTPVETLRISYGGRVYDLRSVVELGRREGLEILAEARAE